jgi:hypothetical protein
MVKTWSAEIVAIGSELLLGQIVVYRHVLPGGSGLAPEKIND